MTGTARRLLTPGVATAVMLAVLLSLGTWQVRRLHWKQEILAQIDKAEAAPPIPLPPDPEPYTKVFVSGTFMSGKAALYGAVVRDIPSGPAMGARMIVPLKQTGGTVILVDRGWVPISRPGPIDQPDGVVTVTGYVRFGDRASWFSARDDPASRRFFTLDPHSIGEAAGLPDVPPFVLVALAAQGVAETGDRWPDPARNLPRPPNNHLSYVFTWYGLAAALLIIFIIWANRGSRE